MSEKLTFELVAINKATAPMKKVQDEIARTGQKFNDASRGVNQFGKQSDKSARDLQKFTQGVMQQAGYQVGDFVVQVTQGTSWMQAFGQQGAQLAGVFGHVGAVFGAGIAIVAALGVTIQKTMGETKSFADNISDLGDAVSDYRDAVKASLMTTKELVDEFGTASTVLQDTLDILERISSMALQSKIDATAKSLADVILGAAGESRLDSSIFAFTAAGEKARDVASGLREEYSNAARELLRGAGNADAQLSAVLRLSDAAWAVAEADGKITDAERDHLKLIADLIVDLKEAGGSIDKTANTYEDILGSSKGLAAAEEALNDIYASRIGTIDTTANTYEDILGSADGLAAAEQALNDIYEARLGTIDDTANNYVDILGSSDGIQAATDALNDLFGELVTNSDAFLKDVSDAEGDMVSLSEIDIASGISAAAIEASDLSRDMKDSLISALGIVNLAKENMSLDPFGGKGDPKYDKGFTIFATWDDGKDKKKGSKKTDPLADLQKKLALEEAIVGKTKAEQKIINELGVDYAKYGEKTISDLTTRIERVDQLNALLTEQQEIADTIRSSMEDAFMSMVDGTNSVEDAFKNMASSIIKELFRIIVVQRTVNSIMSALGTVFPSLAPIAGARAAGGTVTGGRPYLVGEKGPEIVVPGRTGTVIPNGASMGGGVTVIQNNSFGAGVSRAEVNAMLPKMVEATKQAVAETVRRGGSYGGAFA